MSDSNKVKISKPGARQLAKSTGVLSSKRRNSLPSKTFGLPKSRKYPMPDANHAKNAKARATQMVKAGKLSPSSKAQIDAKANRILGK